MKKNMDFMRSALQAMAVCCALICMTNAVMAQGAAKQKVSIQFTASVGAKAFDCKGIYENIGANHDTVKAQDLRYFVSEVELVKKDGTAVPVELEQDGVWQYKNLALMDFEDGTGGCSNGNAGMHKEVTGEIAAGEYTGLRFTLGVPFELNHLDATTAPSPLNMTAMFWNWQSGYKFMRAEVAPVGNPQKDAAKPANGKPAMDKPWTYGFPMHLGSTGCASASRTTAPEKECEHPNRVVISFESFNASTDAVNFDLAKLLADASLSVSPTNPRPSCMSGLTQDNCVPVMRALGLPFRDAAAVPQVVFTRIAK